jgi:putative oxidoreductase
MNNKIIKIFLIILISLLYLSSAYNKITNFNSVADGLKNKLSSSLLFNWGPVKAYYDISRLALLFAIFLIVVGPIMMFYGTIMDNQLVTKIGALSLIVFLILATILYHPPNDPKQFNNFLKNLSLMGGLGILIIY